MSNFIKENPVEVNGIIKTGRNRLAVWIHSYRTAYDQVGAM